MFGNHKWVEGDSYSFLARQMGRNSKKPWVAAEFRFLGPHEEGKIKHETINTEGHFMLIKFPSYDGIFIFKVTDTTETANGPRITATLHIVF